MLDAYDASPRDVSTLELVSSGGAMVAPELVRRVQRTFGCAFSTLYGQTEHSPVITQHHSDDSIDDICNTVGQAVPQTEVSIRRLADNRTADIGEVGEICARSACVMLSYHDDAASTAEAIDPQGWLHTGDLGSHGCARLRDDHRPGEGDDHSRRREPLPRRDRECPARARERCRGLRRRPARRGMGRGDRRLRSHRGWAGARPGPCMPIAVPASRPRRRRPSGARWMRFR